VEGRKAGNLYTRYGLNPSSLSGLTDRTRIVFFETPTNPSMEIIDIAAAVAVAKAKGALVVVDNTFASPVNQSPLKLGADIVVHSTTKYLGDHSDLTGGVIIEHQHRRRAATARDPRA
jgi:cystathionine beta-lyase/cystathionine gamma-synthase